MAIVLVVIKQAAPFLLERLPDLSIVPSALQCRQHMPDPHRGLTVPKHVQMRIGGKLRELIQCVLRSERVGPADLERWIDLRLPGSRLFQRVDVSPLDNLLDGLRNVAIQEHVPVKKTPANK